MSYVELHCHSAYSFLDGASSPEELAMRAAELEHPALALTDHDGVWGAMEFAQACKAFGVRPIVGAEVTVVGGAGHRPPGHIAREERSLHSTAPGRATFSVHGAGAGAPPTRDTFHLTLLVENVTGWKNLSRLLTEAHRGTRPKPDREPLPPSVTLHQVERYAEGLVCLSGCARDGALAGLFERAGGRPSGGESRAAVELGRRLLAAFGRERFRVELQRPFWRHDRARNRWLSGLAERLGVPCVAAGNVHAHHRSRARLQDAFVSIRLGRTLEETEPWRRGNSSSHLVSAAIAAERFREHPEAVAESRRLAERLTFDLTRELGYSYPGAEDPGADRALSEICRARLEHRYAGTPKRAEAERRLEEELRVIRSLRLSGFFLLHYDLLELAREVAAEVRGPDSARSLLPPGRGRGSSVSSIVCYLTGLSHVDPVRAGLFLGRFLNDEITEVPDIDLDFPRDIREKLIPRIHERYGPERSALVSAFACYRSRGAVRDLGKALGLPAGEIERVARSVELYGRWEEVEGDIAEALGRVRAKADPAEGSPEAGSCSGLPLRWRVLARLAREVWGLPRHASQHPGGMVLSTRPLVDLCPVQPAAMEGRQIVQWDKDSCADAGFLKIDLLGLGMLSAVERCVDEIARARGERVDLSRIPLDDREVFGAIRRADTTGTFQIESRAQMQMLPRSRPENLEDLTVQVALVRPGPIQGGAVHPYLERRKRLREDPSYEVPYEHPCLEPILRDTLGAIVFQDQVIQVAMALAGFGAGEAEGLRRAMSRKRSEAAINAYRDRFIEGAQARGVSRGLAERVFEQIHGFSGFGFPKSHATAFALLAYQTAWLRVHYGPEFLCSLLNEQPMGFYPPDALAHEAQRRGIAVRGPDVNESGVDCRVDRSLAVRVGLGYINGLSEKEAEAVVAERERGGPYRDLEDLASRSGAGRDALERLAWAGACHSLADAPGHLLPAPRTPARFASGASPDSRRGALWRLGVARGATRVGAGDQLALPLEVPAAPPLPELDRWERVLADYGATGMALGEHPMALLRADLDEGVVRSVDLDRLQHGSPVRIGGMVVARQRPATARGVVFMLLEDEEGTVNVIVPPPVYERHRLVVRTSPFVVVGGRLERGEGIVNVVAFQLMALDRPDALAAEVRQIEPSVAAETGRDAAATAPHEGLGDLAAVAPRAHSFGRRGR